MQNTEKSEITKEFMQMIVSKCSEVNRNEHLVLTIVPFDELMGWNPSLSLPYRQAITD